MIAKETKKKNWSIKQYLYMICPYFCDMINDHKASLNLRVNLPDKVIYYETQFGEWKIQLTM